MQHLELRRAIVFFDLETTGTDPATDRIVEISALRFEPDGSRSSRTRRINPQRSIPAGATRIHGIRDEDVRDEPVFRQIARSLLEFLDDADLAGFNVARFDVPLLEREFADCGLDLGLAGRRIVDAMTLFHRKEPRDLAAAVRFYLGREHEQAHNAEADVAVTLDVLEAQLERYEDLPRDVEALEAWLRRVPANAADKAGKFVWQDGEAVFSFGKHQGKSLKDVAAQTPDYLEWILQSDFPDDAKAMVSGVLRGELPAPPASDG